MVGETYVEGNTVRVTDGASFHGGYSAGCDRRGDEANDMGFTTEVIDGVVYSMVTGTFRHGIVIANISRMIGNALRGKHCRVFSGTLEYHYRFDDDETRERDYIQPDVMICCDESKLIGTGYYVAPKFVAEVLSHDTAKRDKDLKFSKYESSGVSEYWLVLPSGALDIYYLVDGHYVLEKSIVLSTEKRDRNYNADEVITLREFPDIKMTLGEIFE